MTERSIASTQCRCRAARGLRHASVSPAPDHLVPRDGSVSGRELRPRSPRACIRATRARSSASSSHDIAAATRAAAMRPATRSGASQAAPTLRCRAPPARCARSLPGPAHGLPQALPSALRCAGNAAAGCRPVPSPPAHPAAARRVPAPDASPPTAACEPARCESPPPSSPETPGSPGPPGSRAPPVCGSSAPDGGAPGSVPEPRPRSPESPNAGRFPACPGARPSSSPLRVSRPESRAPRPPASRRECGRGRDAGTGFRRPASAAATCRARRAAPGPSSRRTRWAIRAPPRSARPAGPGAGSAPRGRRRWARRRSRRSRCAHPSIPAGPRSPRYRHGSAGRDCNRETRGRLVPAWRHATHRPVRRGRGCPLLIPVARLRAFRSPRALSCPRSGDGPRTGACPARHRDPSPGCGGSGWVGYCTAHRRRARTLYRTVCGRHRESMTVEPAATIGGCEA